MDILGIIKKRRSIREFADKPVLKQELEKIIDAARFAPTARAVEPWEFVVVTDKEMLKKIADFTEHGKFIAQASACVAVLSIDTKYYLEDCCAATQNILLMAASLGIGSCWVAGDKKSYAVDIIKLLKVPETYKLVSLVALGYPKIEASLREVKKKPLNQLIHWQKYQ